MIVEKTIEDIMNDLIQVDIDAYFAYGKAIEHIEEEDICEQLTSFQSDHKRHIENLSFLLKEAGGNPIEYNKDLKGHIIQGITWLRSITGTEGALKAMMTNEKLTNTRYNEALEHKVFTNEIKQQISENLHDEKRHLEYIKNKLSEFQK